MTKFDRFVVVDWSGGNDTGPRPRKDAIWIGTAVGPKTLLPEYIRNRLDAEAVLAAMIEETLARQMRLFVGFDFPFGFPVGFARGLTGKDDPFAVWEWLERRIEDTPKSNNRFDLAAEINRRFPGTGPFWFNGLRREIADLPRKNTRTGHGLSERRKAEMRAPGAFACWQMGGAGAVGGQILTGLPVLQRLRQRFAGHVSIWPFEPPDRSVAFVEIWPGLINPVVKQAEAAGGLRDAEQVRLLASALSRLPPDALCDMLSIDAPEEGWILGLGQEEVLMEAAKDLRPPPLRDDCFALPAGVDWTPVDQALATLRTRLHAVTGTEYRDLSAAAGRILAQDVVARRSNPPANNSAVDGYALAHSSTGHGDQFVPLVPGRAAAGAPFEGRVPEGHAVQILTGATMPEGTDTVILQEDITTDGTRIAFRGPIKPGANSRKAGEDVTADTVILRSGRRITPADLALCAATGVDRLKTYEPLRVAVLSTGDELAEPGADIGTDHIYDANRPMLLALVRQFGFEAFDGGRVADDRDALRQALTDAASRSDIILTSGGASSGDEDHVSALLNEAGRMQLWRLAVKPGRPLALGLWNGTPVFGLPGNPVAALVCTLIFARPAMALLSGEGWREPEAIMLPAAFEKSKKPGRREYLRARVRDGQAEIFKSEGSGRISGLSWAEGLVELPDGAARIAPGDPVRYLPFSAF
ncbi:MAG: gephyrin-like molybdotransferase Glp [Pseudomonadota bacterium]